jgi:hypothetical protein
MRRHASTVSFDAVAVAEGAAGAAGDSGGPEFLTATPAAPSEEGPVGASVGASAAAGGRFSPSKLEFRAPPPASSSPEDAPFRAKNERIETSPRRFAPTETPAARGYVSAAAGGALFRKKPVSLA